LWRINPEKTLSLVKRRVAEELTAVHHCGFSPYVTGRMIWTWRRARNRIAAIAVVAREADPPRSTD
jgi:hypothetical protein